ncbi:arylsulfatase [Echinicola strongylocentroti]|uniref:Arylsulfatase n=1 Tax=Echinicola strongylocentroti TaxID=1795355 RepID=A0A2Z4IFA5_9BACT|nr:sulfatase-like hydrolase/transferase [Echinicola strongylocentroti]AWW29555.1 arylsulfatase [Echinicola strongylocentroti]
MKTKGTVYFIGLLISFGMLVVSDLQGQDRPNVVIIYTDDHRYSGVGALMDGQVDTPNMDRLVEEGVSFDRAYLMGAFTGATCVASRAMLLTGRNVFNLKGAGHTIPANHPTLGEVFRKSGYYTYIIGKWHQDNASLARSFDSGAALMSRGMYLEDHFRMPLWDWDPSGEYPLEKGYVIKTDHQGKWYRKGLEGVGPSGPIATEGQGPHTSEIYAHEAKKFLEDYDKKPPFLMYLAFHAPHDPRQAPMSFRNAYPSAQINLPPSYMPMHGFDNGHMFLRDEQLAPWPRTEDRMKEELADYYAIISHLDAQIGKVVNTLKATGEYENTIVVLVGDSGLAVGNHGLIGKQNLYDEDGIHVPFVFSGGAVRAKGRREQAFAYIHDILPTLGELTGVPIPKNIDGKSLAPIIRGEEESVRDHTYHAYRQFQRAYRKGDYKLIEYVRAKDSNKKLGGFQAGSKVTQLFNIAKDPWEINNLAINPNYFDKVKELQKEMKAMAAKLNDNKSQLGMEYDFWDYYQ